jgi:hypothetical protein
MIESEIKELNRIVEQYLLYAMGSLSDRFP